MKTIKLELTKYLTNDDIFGFSWNGNKDENNFIKTYTMLSPPTIIAKETQFGDGK